MAGTVGLTCLHVFGFDDPHAPDLAEKLGIAFQLTNICAMCAAIYEMGRVYLPLEDLARFGVRREDLARAVDAGDARPAGIRSRARLEFLREGAELIALCMRTAARRSGRWCASTAGCCARIEERGFRCFLRARVAVSAEKMQDPAARAAGRYGRRRMSSKSVIVIGGGLAGLSSAVALAEAGFRVRLLEKRPHPGRPRRFLRAAGRQRSGQLPARHAGLLHESRRFLPPRRRRRTKSDFFDRLSFVDPTGKRATMEASALPPPLHMAPSFLFFGR